MNRSVERVFAKSVAIDYVFPRASQTRLHALGESRSMKRAVKSVKLHTFYEVLKVLGAVRSGYTHTELNVTCTVSCLPMKIIRLGTFFKDAKLLI